MNHRGAESPGPSSSGCEAIHHHFHRGRHGSGGSTKGLCLGASLAFLGCLRHQWNRKRATKKHGGYYKYVCFWCFCNPFHKKWRPKQGKAFKMKWIQIGSNCPLPLPLPFVCCPLTLPLGASQDSQKAEEYAHLTRSASWQGQFRVLESIQFVGRLLSSEIAVSRWILKDLSVVFRVGVIETHEDQHFSSPMKTTKTDAINEANFTSQPRNTSSWKPSFVALRRSSKDRSRLGDGYWGGVIWRAKSLNSQWSEYVCQDAMPRHMFFIPARSFYFGAT